MIQRLGKYEVLEKLASTRKGLIFKAQDPAIGRVVAIKTIGEPGSDMNPASLERLQQEARAAGNLRHPNIVTIFDADVTHQPPYIVMDYIAGTTLQALLEQQGRMEPAVILSILKQLAEAIDFAHAQGVLHRDIKPGNIMLDPQGRAFILDFGLAVLDSSELSNSATVVGTPAYMSPEQILNKPLDSRSDLFSLAVVSYQMFTGRLPFGGSDYQSIMQSITTDAPHVIERRYRLPAQLEVQLQRGLNKEPKRRFSSAAELVRAIESCFPSLKSEDNSTLRAGDAEAGSTGIKNKASGEPDAQVYVHTARQRTSKIFSPAEWAAVGLLCFGAILLLFYFLGFEESKVSTISDKRQLLQNMASEERVDFTKEDGSFTDSQLIAAILNPEKAGTRLPGILEEARKRKLPWLLDAVLPLLNHQQTKVRLAAVSILGVEGHPESIKALVELLGDKDVEVAIAAARGLETSGSIVIVASLKAKYAQLKSEKDSELKAAIRSAIEKIQGYPLPEE
jgi:serine/threonine protein kinase